MVFTYPTVRIIWEVAWTKPSFSRFLSWIFTFFETNSKRKISIDNKSQNHVAVKQLRYYLPITFSFITNRTWNYPPKIYSCRGTMTNLFVMMLDNCWNVICKPFPWETIKFYLGTIRTVRQFLKTRKKKPSAGKITAPVWALLGMSLRMLFSRF